MNKQGNPLVSFFVMAYNQEAFVQQAIDGAFAQTYQPLEILLSDDCSTDGTFGIMQEMARAYDGPHRIILNKNHENLGIVGHINRIMKVTRGELVVASAGDDISVADRTARLAAAWEYGGGCVHLVHSAVCHISREGSAGEIGYPPQELMDRPDQTIFDALGWIGNHLGSTAAWTRQIFETFGELPKDVLIEDAPIFYRALLIGKQCYINEPLVLYRSEGISARRNVTPGHWRLYSSNRNHFKWRAAVAKNLIKDISVCRTEDAEILVNICQHRISRFERRDRYANMSARNRAMYVFSAIKESFREKSHEPVWEWLVYTFEPITLKILNRRGFGIWTKIKKKMSHM